MSYDVYIDQLNEKIRLLEDINKAKDLIINAHEKHINALMVMKRLAWLRGWHHAIDEILNVLVLDQIIVTPRVKGLIEDLLKNGPLIYEEEKALLEKKINEQG